MFLIRFWGAVVLSVLVGVLAGSAVHSAQIEAGVYQRSWSEVDGHAYVVVVGTIERGDDDVFLAALLRALGMHTAQRPVDIRFDSPGGNLSAGLKIGRYIATTNALLRDANSRVRVETTVPWDGVCYSACALAWLAGERTWAHEQAEIGFHQPSIPGTPPHQFAVDGVTAVAAYLEDLGYDGRVLGLALSASPDEIQLLDETVAAHVGLDLQRWKWR